MFFLPWRLDWWTMVDNWDIVDLCKRVTWRSGHLIIRDKAPDVALPWWSRAYNLLNGLWWEVAKSIKAIGGSLYHASYPNKTTGMLPYVEIPGGSSMQSIFYCALPNPLSFSFRRPVQSSLQVQVPKKYSSPKLSTSVWFSFHTDRMSWHSKDSVTACNS